MDEEPARRNARRSLVAAVAIKAGSVIAEKHLTWKRPAHGIGAKFYKDVIGKKAILDIDEDTVLKWNMFE